MSTPPLNLPATFALPTQVEKTLEDCANRVLELLAAEEALLRAHLQAGDIFPGLLPAGSEQQAQLDSLVLALKPQAEDLDPHLMPDAASVHEELVSRVEETKRIQLAQDLNALRLAQQARQSLAGCAEWQQTLLEAATAWGGEPENALAFAGSFPHLDAVPQHPLAWKSGWQLTRACTWQIEEAYNLQLPPSGFPTLDAATNGLRCGHLWSLESANAADGQRFLRHLAFSVAQSGATVAYLSRESTYSEWTDAMLALAGSPHPTGLIREEVKSDQWVPLATSASTLSELPLYFASSPHWLPSDFLQGVLALRSARPLRLLVVEAGDVAPRWQQDEGLRWLRELAVQQQWTVIWGLHQAHGTQTSPVLWDTRLLLKRVAMASTKKMNFLPELHVEILKSPDATTGTIVLRQNERGGLAEMPRPGEEERKIERAFVKGRLEPGYD